MRKWTAQSWRLQDLISEETLLSLSSSLYLITHSLSFQCDLASLPKLEDILTTDSSHLLRPNWTFSSKSTGEDVPSEWKKYREILTDSVGLPSLKHLCAEKLLQNNSSSLPSDLSPDLHRILRDVERLSQHPIEAIHPKYVSVNLTSGERLCLHFELNTPFQPFGEGIDSFFVFLGFSGRNEENARLASLNDLTDRLRLPEDSLCRIETEGGKSGGGVWEKFRMRPAFIHKTNFSVEAFSDAQRRKFVQYRNFCLWSFWTEFVVD